QSGGGGMCTMSLVITVPGLPSQAVQKANIVKLAKWPMPGAVLPVEAERSDLTRFRILWDEAETSRDRGAAQAQQVADHMNATASREPAGAQEAPTTSSGGRIFATVSVNGQPANPEDIAQFEAMTGMDLNGDGVVPGGAPTVAPTAIPLSGDLAQAILQAFSGA